MTKKAVSTSEDPQDKRRKTLDQYEETAPTIWQPGSRPVLVVRTAKYGRAKYKATFGRENALKHYAESRALTLREVPGGKAELIDKNPLTGNEQVLPYVIESPSDSPVSL